MTNPTQVYLIDAPSPFAPIEEWLEFEASMKKLPQDLPEVEYAMANIKRRKAEEPEMKALLEKSRRKG
ncbi:MAG: hypothetical protein HQ481_06060 [Alphaproteobacteria bacterium]|nr:hypothetical protein [Alphaproteobacteria bacterium]